MLFLLLLFLIVASIGGQPVRRTLFHVSSLFKIRRPTTSKIDKNIETFLFRGNLHYPLFVITTLISAWDFSLGSRGTDPRYLYLGVARRHASLRAHPVLYFRQVIVSLCLIICWSSGGNAQRTGSHRVAKVSLELAYRRCTGESEE